MNRKIYLLIVVFLFSCSENMDEKRQYYSQHVHNDSGKELKNVTLFRNKNDNVRSIIGVLPIRISKIHGGQYTPPANKIIVSWDELGGNHYERQIDLKGIFPSQFNGGQFHVTINKDFSVYYTFVLNKTVYSPTNRTAQ